MAASWTHHIQHVLLGGGMPHELVTILRGLKVAASKLFGNFNSRLLPMGKNLFSTSKASIALKSSSARTPLAQVIIQHPGPGYEVSIFIFTGSILL